MAIFTCPHCKTHVNCTGLIGVVACPHCRNQFVVPPPVAPKVMTPQPLICTGSAASVMPIVSHKIKSSVPQGKVIKDWHAFLVVWIVATPMAVGTVLALSRNDAKFNEHLGLAMLLPTVLPCAGLAMWFLGHSMLSQVNDNPGLGCIYGPAAFLVPLVSVIVGAVVIHLPLAIVTPIASLVGYRMVRTDFSKRPRLKL